MDGENNGKPYEQMDDLGVPYFWKHPNGLEMYFENKKKYPCIICTEVHYLQKGPSFGLVTDRTCHLAMYGFSNWDVAGTW